MACTFSSLKYPGRAPEGHVLLRAFVGGSLQPELFHDDDATMEKNVRDELASLLGVIAQPFSRGSGAIRTPCPSIMSAIRRAFSESKRNSQNSLVSPSPAAPIMASVFPTAYALAKRQRRE